MQSLFMILVLGILTGFVSACQTPEDFYGSGPLTLSPNMKKFTDKYSDGGTLSAVAIRKDGKYGYAMHCPAGTCTGSGVIFNALSGCEQKGGKCWLYSVEGNVVWKGLVTVGNSQRRVKRAKRVEQISDEDICQYSIDHSGQSLKWDTANPSKYLDEARRRGLTLTACSKYEPEAIPAKTTSPNRGSPAVEERLSKLKDLLSRGLLTEGEAAEKRKEILKSL